MNRRALAAAVALAAALSRVAGAAPVELVDVEIPTGQTITPTAAAGAIFQDLNPRRADAPDLRAGQAAALAVSPDGTILAVLSSGYNLYSDASGLPDRNLSTEYVFLFDISGAQPTQLQVLPVAHAFPGLSWAPSSSRLYVSGGKDDSVLEFVRNGSAFSVGRTFKLGHQGCIGKDLVLSGELSDRVTKKLITQAAADAMRDSVRCGQEAAGLALSPDGSRLLVANLQNDSVSVVNISDGRVFEQDLRPGVSDPKLLGKPGGSYPRAVAWVAPNRAYVASVRDREVIALDVTGPAIRILRRIPVRGALAALIANREGSRLFAALDTTNQVAIFDTADDRLLETLDVTAPQSVFVNKALLGGANTNALALTPNEDTLLVSNGGENAVAVVRLSSLSRGFERRRQGVSAQRSGVARQRSTVMGQIPTGWYPTGVATSKDGRTWYVINAKSPTGPNSSWCQDAVPMKNICVPRKWAFPGDRVESPNGTGMLVAENRYVLQMQKAGLLSMPASTPQELKRLTQQVARNVGFDREQSKTDERLFSFLRGHVKHVVYVLKFNRSYDQVLGDLAETNGDSRLTIFPEVITPNHHRIAKSFVTLDNFFVSGAVGWTGWEWSTAAQTTDLLERAEPISMADGFPKFENGLNANLYTNRGVNMAFETSRERREYDPFSPSDPTVLPGAFNVYAPDGPGGERGRGFLWDAALRAHLTVRDWGMLIAGVKERIRQPYLEKRKTAWATVRSLVPYVDPYFPGGVPDYWRVKEWKREFTQFDATGVAPNLMMVALGGDHLGSYETAVDAVNTPETQMADNDYALGSIVETVAESRFAADTLVVSIEIESRDGPDHVDAHRSIVLFAGPYVRQHARVSTRYTTVNVVKTIEEILGIGPMGLNDMLAIPMSDVFDREATSWSYQTVVPEALRSTNLPLEAEQLSVPVR